MTHDFTVGVAVGAVVVGSIVASLAIGLCSGSIKEIAIERDGAKYLVRTYAEALRGPVEPGP